MNLHDLKTEATHSETKLNAYKEAAVRRYDPNETFVYTTVLSMLEGLQSLYSQGYKPVDMPHFMQPPSYYHVFLEKPKMVQEEELEAAREAAEAQYYADLELAKEAYVIASAEATVREAEEAERLKAERKREKAMSEAMDKARKEVGL